MNEDERQVDTMDRLEALYGAVAPQSLIKEIDHIHPMYRPFIETAPFVVLATSGNDGIDVTPRGDPAGFVQIENDRTLILPDRRGNNRIDSLRNIIIDPRVALLFMVPGVGETLRVKGTAEIFAGQHDRFAVAGHVPTTILRITVNRVFFQCSRAVVRAGLREDKRHPPRACVPSAGAILRALSDGAIDGDAYDRALPQRIADTLY